jgi:peptidyl-tRNA hydrolase, PTH1 family
VTDATAVTANDAMKAVVGLGNPGPSYAQTRHNVGFWVVEELAARHHLRFARGDYRSHVARGRIRDEEVVLLKPQTFMNASGEAVGRARRDLGLEAADIIVVYDDLDIPVGRIRVRGEAGAGGHHGVESVIEALGSRAFPRVRVGIGRPGGDPMEHVLGTPAPQERELLEASVERAADAVEVVLDEGVGRAMNRFNGASPT